MKKIKDLLINPANAIARAKKEKDISKTSSLLVLELFLTGLAIVIVSSASLTGIATALGTFLLSLPLILFFALVLKIVMVTLGGRGKYFEGLTAITYGMFAISVGLLISSVLFYLPIFGFLLSVLILAVAAALSIATFYRAVKELFAVDMITAWIGIGLTAAGIIVAVYLSAALLLAGSPNLFQTLLTAGKIA